MINTPGVTEFIDLQDAPSSYSGQTGKVVKVNAGETAVEFGIGGGSLADTYETVSQNIKAYPVTFTYTGDLITQVDYDIGTGTVVKTISYTGDKVSSIVLSGDTPSGIDLTKTFSWSGETLLGYSYS
jgi:hypothetical protein